MAFSKAAAQMKNRRSPRPPPTSRVLSLLPSKPGNTTATPADTLEVTVARFSGLVDEDKELAIRQRPPADIVCDVQAALQEAFKNPAKLVSGRWPLSKPGNFMYTFSGPNLDFNKLGPYHPYLLRPFGDSGAIVPTNGWAWAQVRGVMTTDFNGHLHSSEQLTCELTANNTALNKLAFCSLPKWQSLHVVENSDCAMVLFTYYDPMAQTSASIDKAPVFMFAEPCKLMVSGSSPSPKQCSCCWRITHNVGRCPLPPHTVRCSICGGKHHNSQHGLSCPTKQKHCGPLFDHCNCPKTCLNCKKSGHTARSCQCEHIGDHCPAPLSAVPSPPRQSVSPAPDANGFVPVRKPRARIITAREGIANPQSRLLTGANQFTTISPDMLASPEAIALALADAHVDQSTLDADCGDRSGLLSQGLALALTVKLGLPLTATQTAACLSSRLKDGPAWKHLQAVNKEWGGRADDDSLAALTPINYFHHQTKATYNFPLLFLDTLSSTSIHPTLCVHVERLYEHLAGYPTWMWPRLLHAADLASNGTRDMGTLRHLMGSPLTASFFDNHHTTLLTNAFADVARFTKEGIYRLRKRIPNMYDGFKRPREYHAAKAEFIDKHTPAFMAAINKHYAGTWSLTLKSAAQLLISHYHSACDNEEADGTLSTWLDMHIPSLHREHLCPPLIPFL